MLINYISGSFLFLAACAIVIDLDINISGKFSLFTRAVRYDIFVGITVYIDSYSIIFIESSRAYVKLPYNLISMSLFTMSYFFQNYEANLHYALNVILQKKIHNEFYFFLRSPGRRSFMNPPTKQHQ